MGSSLGSEGDAGQGVRAVSALVGHSHPTTTIRHCAHVVRAALCGVLRKLDSPDMSRCFEDRLGSKATIYRWMAQIRERNRALRRRIEQRCRDEGVDRDQTALPTARDFVSDAAEIRLDDDIHFDRLELVARSLRDGHLLVSEAEAAVYRADLEWVAWRMRCMSKSSSNRPRSPRGIIVGAPSPCRACGSSVWMHVAKPSHAIPPRSGG